MATVEQGQTGVVTQWGRFSHTLPAGRHKFNICSEDVTSVNRMTQTLDLKAQLIMSADNLRLQVDAVVYFHVEEAQKAIFQVESYMQAVTYMVQVQLRNVVGMYTLQEAMAERQKISARVTELCDMHTRQWGLKIQRVEMKQIEIDPNMQRALAAKAEASQQAEAKIIQARAQKEAAGILAEAGRMMQAHPAAMKLQWFETLRIIATQGKNTTMVLPDNVDVERKRGR